MPQQQETVEVVETTVYVERPTTDSKVIVVKEQKSAGSPNKQKTLSVLTVTDNKGCPTRDPSSYGVFLKSERVENGILCYYD